MLAVVRPNDWDLPLLLHVTGALLYTAALIVAATFTVAAWRPRADGNVAALARLGYRSMLVGVLPAYVLMRGAAEWIVSKEDLGDADLDWINIGYGITDAGLLLIIAATITAGMAARRAPEHGPTGLSRAAGIITILLVVLAFVGLWAMTAKPGS